MQIHDVTRENPNKDGKRVGRGGKRGTYSGKGMKGQKSRAGHNIRPDVRDTIKKIPKKRGFGKNRGRTVNASAVSAIVVNIAVLDKLFEGGDEVTPKTLLEKNAIRAAKGVKPTVKILGNGTLSKKLTVSGVALSGAARKAIEENGGTVK
jgi:large subunit ribosomal protein L15